MSRFFDKHSLFRAPNETFSLAESIQLSGKLSRLKNKHVRKNVHASRLNANGSKLNRCEKETSFAGHFGKLNVSNFK